MFLVVFSLLEKERFGLFWDGINGDDKIVMTVLFYGKLSMMQSVETIYESFTVVQSGSLEGVPYV